MDIDQEQIKEFNLDLYRGTHEQDLALLRWWMGLHESGEVHDVFTPATQTLKAFLSVFDPPTILVLSYDPDAKLRMTIWFTPFNSATPSTFVATWTRVDFRASRPQIRLMNFVMLEAFKHWPIIRAITKFKHLDLYQKCGYDVLGSFTEFYPGEAGYLLETDHAKYTASRVFKIGVQNG